jgi:hypothetical protein
MISPSSPPNIHYRVCGQEGGVDKAVDLTCLRKARVRNDIITP